jgi:hypothetical protein
VATFTTTPCITDGLAAIAAGFPSSIVGVAASMADAEFIDLVSDDKQ